MKIKNGSLGPISSYLLQVQNSCMHLLVTSILLDQVSEQPLYFWPSSGKLAQPVPLATLFPVLMLPLAFLVLCHFGGLVLAMMLTENSPCLQEHYQQWKERDRARKKRKSETNLDFVAAPVSKNESEQTKNVMLGGNCFFLLHKNYDIYVLQ